MSWLRAHRRDLALLGLVLALSVPIVQPLRAQQASRMALTAAIWDDASLRIDGYPIGVDRAEHDGHVYSDKAPGQPLFAVPAYAAYRLLGGEPAKVFREEGNLGLWAANLWSCVLPVAILLLLVRRVADEVVAGSGVLVAVLTYVATLLLPFSSVLFGHALSACLAFAGWFAVRHRERSNLALFVCGALFGAAVLVEYTLVLPAALVGAALLWTERARVWRFVVGGLPFVVALGAYQWAAFGSPTAFSYARSTFGEASRERGFEDLDPPLVENSIRVLIGERGLIVISPILVLAVIGMVLLLRRRPSTHDRTALLAALASAGSLVAVQMAWSNATGGDSPGPRYATAAIAFLAPGLALATARWPRTTRATGALGALVMVTATWTDPLISRDTDNAIGVWIDRFFAGEWANTVFEMAAGPGATVLLPLLAVAAIVAVVAADREGATEPVSPRPAARASDP